MRIIVDDKAGPCGGVKRVIRLAEKSLAAGAKTASLGEVIHNDVEIARLRGLGMTEVDHSVFTRTNASSRPERVVIRAHGEPPAVFAEARRQNLEIIDGTCPVVTRSQRLAQKYHELGYQVVVVGKPKHAEVIAILGYCNNEAKVVHDAADIEQLDPDRRTYVLAQTTISDEMWNTMLAAIQARVRDVTYRNTICAFVADREAELRTFAASCDVILLVGGHNSSNTRVMFDVCRGVNPRSHRIESAAEIKMEWLTGAGTVGISGSASTPQWLLEKTAEALARRCGLSPDVA